MLRTALLLLLLLPAVAQADDSASVFTDPDAGIGDGRPFLTRAVETYSLTNVEADHVAVGLRLPDRGASWSLSYAAPRGAPLEPRNYLSTQRTEFAEPGSPGQNATFATGCNRSYGRFELRDLVRRADGSVRRMWLLFQLHCEYRIGGTWGEIRVGMPDTPLYPTVVRWSEFDAWEPPGAAAVRYDGAAAPLTVQVVGANAGDFRVEASGCSASPCDIPVRFEPAGSGVRTATLRVTDAAGTVHESALEAFVHGGTTSMTTDRGAEHHAWTPANAVFHGAFYDNQVARMFGDEDPQSFDGSFSPGSGGWQAGKAYAGGRVIGTAQPGMVVAGICSSQEAGGRFTPHELTLDGEGDLRTFDVEWEMDCDGSEGRYVGARGRWRWRAGDTNPLAPWLLAGPRTGLGPLPPEPASPAPSPSAPAPVTTVVQLAERGCAKLQAIRGTARADRLRGTAAADRLVGFGGRDRLLGRGGADCLQGGSGDDRLEGGAGADSLFGGAGRDVLSGGPGPDLLDCGAGRDHAVAGRGDRTRRCERVTRRSAG